MKFEVPKTFIYKHRYLIGYLLVAICLISALLFVGIFLPGGISNAEMQSVVKSSAVNIRDFWSLDVLNMPYHLLQHGSIVLFGVSNLSIKLPSLVLAFLSIVGIVLILKNWFKPSIAILATLIAVTTGQFLFVAQNGTPDIMYLFWPVCLLLIAILTPLQQKFRKAYVAAFFAVAVFSLYTPLSLYVILVIAAAIVLHPHLRYLTKQLSRVEVIMGLIISLILVSPLVIALYKNPSLTLNLIGIPSSRPDLWSNLSLLGTQYLGFANPGGSTVITPFFELGSVLLIILGFYYIYKTKATAKSYVIILWLICLLPILVLNPSLTTVTFLPLVLLLASGLNGLLSHWYGLFPRNPYARIGGLIPVVVLVSVLVLSGVNRFVYSYLYSPKIVPNFSKDISLIPSGRQNIIVSTSELPFYSVVAKYNAQITVNTQPSGAAFIATHDAKRSFGGYAIDKIITNGNTNLSDRLYLYKKIGS
jgi:hypothetical protein